MTAGPVALLALAVVLLSLLGQLPRQTLAHLVQPVFVAGLGAGFLVRGFPPELEAEAAQCGTIA